MKKAFYIDMDGTLARFHDADKTFIEAMWTPGFYVNLKPFENIVSAIKRFIERNPDVEVYVLSAVLDTEPPFVVGEKNAWLDKYLPEVDKAHRIFTRAGEDKSQYINMQSYECVLLDDYNKNLYEFEVAGGKGIKFCNDINHRGLGEFGGSKGYLWAGSLVNYKDTPEVICSNLEEYLGVEKEQSDFVIEDNILLAYKGHAKVVTIPEGVEVIDVNAFWNNHDVEKVVFPESVQTVLSGAFADCSCLRDVVLPTGLKTVEKNAFLGCSSLSSITIPESVSFFHNQAFDFCENLKHIHVSGKNKNCFSVAGIVFKQNDVGGNRSTSVFRCPCGRSGVVALASLDKVDAISPEAFMNCTSITDVYLPQSLKAIGDGAFYNCSAINRLEIPEHTTKIGDHVLAQCSSLTSVVIPDNIQEMGHGIFEGCKNLSEIVISDNALVDYCEKFNFLDEVFMTPCYNTLKERYEVLRQDKGVDSLIEDANKRVVKHGEVANEDYTK